MISGGVALGSIGAGIKQKLGCIISGALDGALMSGWEFGNGGGGEGGGGEDTSPSRR